MPDLPPDPNPADLDPADLDPADLDLADEPLHEILPRLRARMDAHGEARVVAPHPDLGPGLYPGERGPAGRHRPLGVWVDVAERLGADLLVPEARGDRVLLTFRRAAPARPDRSPDRYGPGGEFQRVDKLEDPNFLEDMLEALGRAAPPPGGRVLSVGVNAGNELRLLDLAFGGAFAGRPLSVVGLDRDAGALGLARARFPQHAFVELDVNALADPGAPDLGRFDLVLALSVLQSPGVRQDDVFRALLRRHLAPGGALIVGLPNGRYEGGRHTYGARLRNFRRPDLSLLVADLALYRRHLQKHGFRVFVTGKHEVLLTAVPARRPGPPEPGTAEP